MYIYCPDCALMLAPLLLITKNQLARRIQKLHQQLRRSLVNVDIRRHEAIDTFAIFAPAVDKLMKMNRQSQCQKDKN